MQQACLWEDPSILLLMIWMHHSGWPDMQISKDEGVSYPRMFWGNFFYLQGFKMTMLTSKIMSKVNIFIFLIQESVFFSYFLRLPVDIWFFFSFFITYILSILFSLLMNLKLKVLEWMLQSHHFAMEAFHLFKLQISSTLWLMILICKVGYVNWNFNSKRADTFIWLIGKIAAANVLSDLYAMGVTECDNMLMLVGVSTKMSEKERDIVMPLIMRGFKVYFVTFHFYLKLTMFYFFFVLLGLCLGSWY